MRSHNTLKHVTDQVYLSIKDIYSYTITSIGTEQIEAIRATNHDAICHMSYKQYSNCIFVLVPEVVALVGIIWVSAWSIDVYLNLHIRWVLQDVRFVIVLH